MDPFVGQISLVSFNYAPKGWALCNGQALSISQNQPLFSIIGTTFGGDGISTFNLPDLRGRAAMHIGKSAWGASGGQETVTLAPNQIATHTHLFVNAVDAPSDQYNPPGCLWGVPPATAGFAYIDPSKIDGSMAPNALNNAGGGQPHENMQPSLVVNFIIALQGIYPSKD